MLVPARVKKGIDEYLKINRKMNNMNKSMDE